MIKIKLVLLDEDLRKSVGEKEVTLEVQENSTIKDLLSIAAARYSFRVLDALLKPGTSIMLNGQNIEFLGGVKARLSDGDRVAIIPPVAGG